MEYRIGETYMTWDKLAEKLGVSKASLLMIRYYLGEHNKNNVTMVEVSCRLVDKKYGVVTPKRVQSYFKEVSPSKVIELVNKRLEEVA